MRDTHANKLMIGCFILRGETQRSLPHLQSQLQEIRLPQIQKHGHWEEVGRPSLACNEHPLRSLLGDVLIP